MLCLERTEDREAFEQWLGSVPEFTLRTAEENELRSVLGLSA